jgi:dTDP-4-dehydrorhamnose 3,5-epimerase
MEKRETSIKGLIEIIPKIFPDERGIFFESYSKKKLKELGLDVDFVQDNMSKSTKGVLRGLHFQRKPFEQGKLVSVISGKVLDVAVDIRPESETFGQFETFILDDVKRNILYIPEGFAHGFLALEESILTYKCTNLYNKEAESGIIWNDKQLNIHWGIENPLVSEKDQILLNLSDLALNK